jgi:serine/threonine-protein kinase
MSDVFVSYKAEDRPRVAPLVQALEANGLSVWWDTQIAAGSEWRSDIQSQLDAARCVIVVWSKQSVGHEGRFVRDEASRAQRRGTYLPILIDDVEPPLGFGELHAISLAGWRGKRRDGRFRTLMNAVRAVMSGETPRTAVPEEPTPVSRRNVMVGGGAAIALAAGVGAWEVLKPGKAKAANSVAVLPFANLSGDPNQAYFSDGIAEELRSALSRIAGLKVVARTSSEAVRNEDAKTAAQNLGVGNILTGSVRRSPEMIRISAQLVDGKEGIERWSDVYDRPPGDALQIQTDIANKVAEALSIRLAPADRRRIEEGGTDNADAQDLLLKAQNYAGKDIDPDSLQRAIGTVDAALTLDPKYANAFAVKAQLLSEKAGNYSRSAAEYRQGYGLAEQNARRAIALAPRSRFGYLALADVLDAQLQRRAAFVQFQKMASLPGDDSKTLPTYAIFLSEIGRSSEALRLADQAISLDPLNPLSYGRKAMVLANARRFPEAIAAVDKTLELAPHVQPARSFHAYCVAMAGNIQQARKELSALNADLAQGAPGNVAPLVATDHALGERILAHLQQTTGEGAYYQIAQILAQLGKKEKAIGALEKAYTVKDPGLTMMLVDPTLDPLRADPRFQALFKRLDFPS